MFCILLWSRVDRDKSKWSLRSFQLALPMVPSLVGPAGCPLASHPRPLLFLRVPLPWVAHRPPAVQWMHSSGPQPCLLQIVISQKPEWMRSVQENLAESLFKFFILMENRITPNYFLLWQGQVRTWFSASFTSETPVWLCQCHVVLWVLGTHWVPSRQNHLCRKHRCVDKKLTGTSGCSDRVKTHSGGRLTASHSR